MKHKVKYSSYSIVISSIGILVILGVILNLIHRGFPVATWLVIGALAMLIIFALCYAPISISVSDSALCIHRLVKTKRIPLAQLQSVERVAPTMSEKRICGSGGWFGYWGRMSEPTLGQYFAYYGKASDCFLVTLKDGRRYLLGCENPATVVDFLRSRIDNN